MATNDKNVEGKARALLRQGSEHEKLDYKVKLDISDNGSCVELIKDIGAMLSSEGGTILIGADDLGEPVPDFTDAMANAFDEAKLRSKIKKYIAEPIDILTSSAKVDSFNHLIIECGSYPNGFIIFKADGQYVKPNGSLEEVFKKGDVYVRHGSASERWEQHDIVRIINSEVSKRKIEWLKDVELIINRLGKIENQTEKQTLDSLKGLSKELKSGVSKNTINISDVKIALDEVSIIMLNAVSDDSEKIFMSALGALHQIYSLGFDYKGSWRLDRNYKPEEIWHEVLIRLPIIGGYCVENKKYTWAKSLAFQKVPGDDGRHFNNWYRHAFTMSARSNKFSKDRHKKSNLIDLATNLAIEDERYQKLLAWDEEQAVTECAKFDYLAAIVALDQGKEINTSNFYTSFAFHGKDRITQLLVDVILDEETRKLLFIYSDENLAYILQQMDELAQGENIMGWHTGDWPFGLRDFIKKAAPFQGQGS